VDQLKILITGGTGLLGKALVYQGKDMFNLSAVYIGRVLDIPGVNYYEADIRDREALVSTTRWLAPEVIIHTAALTDVDLCERENALAYEVNCQGTRNIVDAAEMIGARLVYISTDFVFDGIAGDYGEDDQPHPVNYYGETKLIGEGMVGRCPESLIIRTSFYGLNPCGDKKGLEAIIEKISEGEMVLAPTDMWNSMISAKTLSQMAWELIQRGAKGLYHVASEVKMSRYDFLKCLSSVLDRPADTLVPIDYQEYQKGRDAVRPQDVSLDVTKLRNDFGLSAPSVKEDLKSLLGDFREYIAFFGRSRA